MGEGEVFLAGWWLDTSLPPLFVLGAVGLAVVGEAASLRADSNVTNAVPLAFGWGLLLPLTWFVWGWCSGSILWPDPTHDEWAGLIAFAAILALAVVFGVQLVAMSAAWLLLRVLRRPLSQVRPSRLRAPLIGVLVLATLLAGAATRLAIQRPTVESWRAGVTVTSCRHDRLPQAGDVPDYFTNLTCQAEAPGASLSLDNRRLVARLANGRTVEGTFVGLAGMLAPPASWVLLSWWGTLFAAFLVARPTITRQVAELAARQRARTGSPYREAAEVPRPPPTAAEIATTERRERGWLAVAALTLVLTCTPLAIALALRG